MKRKEASTENAKMIVTRGCEGTGRKTEKYKAKGVRGRR